MSSAKKTGKKGSYLPVFFCRNSPEGARDFSVFDSSCVLAPKSDLSLSGPPTFPEKVPNKLKEMTRKPTLAKKNILVLPGAEQGRKSEFVPCALLIWQPILVSFSD